MTKISDIVPSRKKPVGGNDHDNDALMDLPGIEPASSRSSDAGPVSDNPAGSWLRGGGVLRGGRSPHGRMPRGKQRQVGEKPRWKQLLTQKKFWLRLLGIVLLIGVLVGGWLGYKFWGNLTKMLGGRANVLDLLVDTKLRGEDRGRINVLLAGDSSDDPNHGGADLTDSIMILSINTQDNSAFMLSVPRDLWVNIPGHGHQKINAVKPDGDADDFSESGYPAGGMGLLEKVIEKNFGIQIDYYGLVNYTAFRDAVNAVGGIDVNIQSSDSRGLYDPNIEKKDGGPLRLKNGMQHLDGQTALNLARARGHATADGRIGYGFPRADFDRTDHQRLMLAALATKAMSAGVLTNPVKIGQLLDAVGNNVKTDFQTKEVRGLARIAKNMDFSKMQSLSLVDQDVNLITDYTSPDGQSALIPKAGIDDYSDIARYVKKMTTNDPIVREDADVVVLNASNTSGVAKKQADALAAKNISVAATGNAAATTTTMVVDASAGKMPGTKAALVKLYGSNVVTGSATAKVAATPAGSNASIANALARTYPSADFIVVLGSDWAARTGSSDVQSGQ